jgi:hypothetical protein
MSKTVRLTNGFDTIVDDVDYLKIAGCTLDYSHGYARVRGGFYVHELLTEAKVFHLNGNRLDNQRSNFTTTFPKKVAGQHGIYRMPKANIFYVITGDVTRGPFTRLHTAQVAYNLLKTGSFNKVDPIVIRGGQGPEAKIQSELIAFLEARGWFVKVTVGTAMSSGFPDLFCCHKNVGTRWIDVKNPKSWRLTPAQKDVWPKMTANGSGVWILTAATQFEYEKLFAPANWHLYYK